MSTVLDAIRIANIRKDGWDCFQEGWDLSENPWAAPEEDDQAACEAWRQGWIMASQEMENA